MKRTFNFHSSVLLLAFLSWLAPLLLSFFFIHPETRDYTIPVLWFKGLMILTLALCTWASYRYLLQKGVFNLQTANTFLLVQVIADFTVLIAMFKVAFPIWLFTILPIYVIIFYGLYGYFTFRK